MNRDILSNFSHSTEPFTEDELQSLITFYQNQGEDRILAFHIIILLIERLNFLASQEVMAICAPTDDQIIRFIFSDMKDDPYYELLAAKALKVAHYQMKLFVINRLDAIKNDKEGVTRAFGIYMTSMAVTRDIKEYDGNVPLKEYLQQRIETVLRLFEASVEMPGD